MRKEASTAQWKELYEGGLKIKELETWKDLWDDDCYGINTFIG